MTKIITPTVPDTLTDPWQSLPASWTRTGGTRTQRGQAEQAPRKPLVWQRLPDPADRALVATYARQVLADDPTIGFAFATRLLEHLRARAGAARPPAEREQAVRLVAVLSRNLSELPDLLMRLRALTPKEA